MPDLTRGQLTCDVTVHCATCHNRCELPQVGRLFPSWSGSQRQAKSFGWRYRRDGGWQCPCCRHYDASVLSVGQEVALARPMPHWVPYNRGVVLAILPPGVYPPRVRVQFQAREGHIWEPTLGYRDVVPLVAA